MEKSHPVLQMIFLVASGLLVYLSYWFESPYLKMGAIGTSIAAIATSFAYWIDPCPEKCPPCPPCPPCTPCKPGAQEEQRPECSPARSHARYVVTSPATTPMAKVPMTPEKSLSVCTIPEATVSTCSLVSIAQPLSPSPLPSPPPVAAPRTATAVILFRRMCHMEFLHLAPFFWCLAEDKCSPVGESPQETALKNVLRATKLKPEDVVLRPNFSEVISFKSGSEVTKIVTYYAAEVNPCAKVAIDHKWLPLEKSLKESSRNCVELLRVLRQISRLHEAPAFKPVCVKKRQTPWFKNKKSYAIWNMMERTVCGNLNYKRKWTIDNTHWNDEEHECFCPQEESEGHSRTFWILTVAATLVVMVASGLALTYLISPDLLKIK